MPAGLEAGIRIGVGTGIVTGRRVGVALDSRKGLIAIGVTIQT